MKIRNIIIISLVSFFIFQTDLVFASWGKPATFGITTLSSNEMMNTNVNCKPEYKFDPYTGKSCAETEVKNDPACLPDFLFNPNTGEPCPNTNTSLTIDNATNPANAFILNPTYIVPPLPQTTPQASSRILKEGMTGNDVKDLQIYLNTHNFPISLTGLGSSGNETIYFGQKTKDAVMTFQKANHLISDGIVGPKTTEKLK